MWGRGGEGIFGLSFPDASGSTPAQSSPPLASGFHSLSVLLPLLALPLTGLRVPPARKTSAGTRRAGSRARERTRNGERQRRRERERGRRARTGDHGAVSLPSAGPFSPPPPSPLHSLLLPGHVAPPSGALPLQPRAGGGPRAAREPSRGSSNRDPPLTSARSARPTPEVLERNLRLADRKKLLYTVACGRGRGGREQSDLGRSPADLQLRWRDWTRWWGSVRSGGHVGLNEEGVGVCESHHQQPIISADVYLLAFTIHSK